MKTCFRFTSSGDHSWFLSHSCCMCQGGANWCHWLLDTLIIVGLVRCKVVASLARTSYIVR